MNRLARYTTLDAILAIAGLAWTVVALWRLPPLRRHVHRTADLLSAGAARHAGTPLTILSAAAVARRP